MLTVVLARTLGTSLKVRARANANGVRYRILMPLNPAPRPHPPTHLQVCPTDDGRRNVLSRQSPDRTCCLSRVHPLWPSSLLPLPLPRSTIHPVVRDRWCALGLGCSVRYPLIAGRHRRPSLRTSPHLARRWSP